MNRVKIPSDILSKHSKGDAWKSWNVVDEDLDYKEWKTIKLQTPYKPLTIDYSNILDKIYTDKETEESYGKVKQWMNDYMSKRDLKDIFGTFTTPVYSPYIPMTAAIANPNATVKVKEKTVFDEYPITNAEWHEYHDGEFSTLVPLPSSITQAQKALEVIDKTHQSGTKVFIARSRSVRDDSGHMNDPWHRSMATYRPNFKSKLLSRQQTKVEVNSCDELLTWQIETTLKGTSVLLVVWETVKMSYVRRRTIQHFLDNLEPTTVKLDKIYEV